MNDKKAPHELILRWVKEIEKKYVLSEHFQAMKEMFPRLAEDMNQDGKCWMCKSPAEGHFFEECVVRTHGTIAHCYRKPPTEVKNE